MSVSKDPRRGNKHKTNMGLAENNPCLSEHKASLKCLDVHGYNKEMCQDKFENYKACKEFWYNIKLERFRRGIEPTLPPLEEREAIRKEHYGK